MTDFFISVFGAPQGERFISGADLIWLNIVADALLACAFFTIPIALLIVVRRRPDLSYNWLLSLFAAFIFLGGTLYLVDIWNILRGEYRLEGYLKLAAAIVAGVTAIAVWPVLPRILAHPSARSLSDEIARRQRAQEDLQKMHGELESRVRERTTQLGLATKELSRLAAIVDSSNDAIIGLDLQGRVLSWNSAAYRVFGYSANEMLGENISKLFVSKDREEIDTLNRQIRQGGTLINVETERLRKDGVVIPISMTVSPLLDDEGDLEGVSLIARDVTEQRQARERIEASLKEKEMLLKEIHHRVKNNMQVISSLLRLQSAQLTDPQAKAMLQDSEERVRSMALVHEKLYKSEGVSRVDFTAYVRQLSSDLFRTYSVAPRGIVLSFDIDQVELGIDKAIPCGLILNELITNSFKHAFGPGDRGEVKISLQRHGPNVSLQVTDNGIGLPQDVDLDLPRSLGLRVIRTLSEQLGAILEVSREGGTSFALVFAADEFTNERRHATNGAPEYTTM